MRSQTESTGGRPIWRLWLAFVVTCFLVYSANGRELGLADTIPATLLPASILREGDFDLDEFLPLFRERSPDGYSTIGKQLQWTTAIRRVHGTLRSSYPIGAAILSVPVYAIPVALGELYDFSDYRLCGKLAASILSALAAGFVLLALLRFVSRRSAVLLSGIFAFGTGVWVIASQALWQHGPALLCLAFATWAALRLVESGRKTDAALVSFGAAMTVVCRPQDAIGALAIWGFACFRAPRRIAALAIPGAVVMALQIFYNWKVFGTLSGGYADLYQSPAHAWRGLDATSTFTLPLVEGLAGLLVSPGKGLFVYSPVLAVAIVALPVAAAARGAVLARALTAWVALSLVLYAKNQLWWGGTSYGPRYLTELALPLVLGLGFVWTRVEVRKALRGAIVALAGIGVLVQALGAFTWECGWHLFPAWLDFRPDRVWDVRDPEVLRCAERLLASGPRTPDLGPFAPERASR